MASQPIDQGAILRSGAALIPNYAEDMIRRQLADAQVMGAEANAMQAQTQQTREQRAAQRQQAFQTAVEGYQGNPTSQGLVQLMTTFPEFSEGARRAFQSQDETRQRTDRTQLAEIAWASTRGNYDVAARTGRQRLEADQAAGEEPDPAEAAILADLESGDPARQRSASEAVGHLYATTGTNSATDLEALGLRSRPLQEMGGLLLDGTNVVAQDPRGRIIPGPNGSFYQLPPLAGVPLLGGAAAPAPTPVGAAPTPAAPAAPAPASEAPAPTRTSSLPRAGQPMPVGMFRGWQVIGEPGDPRRRAGGRRVPHNGVDFRPPPNNPHLTADRPLEIVSVQPDHGISGITAVVRFPDGAQFNLMHLASPPRPGRYDAGQVIATAGRTGNARNGSTQIHVQPWGGTRHDPRAYFGGGVGTVASPVRIRTRQQYEALASGATYIPPDGSPPRTKP